MARCRWSEKDLGLVSPTGWLMNGQLDSDLTGLMSLVFMITHPFQFHGGVFSARTRAEQQEAVRDH